MDSPERLNVQSSRANSNAHNVAFQATTSELDGSIDAQPSMKDCIWSRASAPDSRFSFMALGPSLDPERLNHPGNVLSCYVRPGQRLSIPR